MVMGAAGESAQGRMTKYSKETVEQDDLIQVCFPYVK